MLPPDFSNQPTNQKMRNYRNGREIRCRWFPGTKYSQGDLIENCCDYKEGNLPSLDQSLLTITADSGIMDVFSIQIFIISCLFAFFIHQVITSQIQISSSSLMPMMLLAVTLSTREVKRKESRYKVWSDIFSLFSDYLNTQHQERSFSSKQCLLLFFIFHCVLFLHPLVYQDLVFQNSLPFIVVLIVGSSASISALHKPSSSFLLFMISNILVTW